MKTVQGDLLALALVGHFDVIVHGCNCQCRMRRGIAAAISTQFPEAEAADASTTPGDDTKLGTFTRADIRRGNAAFVVVNAYTQFHWRGKGVLANYDAIRRTFRAIKSAFSGKRIGYPRLGAGLAGGDWATIEAIICEELAGEDHTLVEFQDDAQKPPQVSGTINFYSTSDDYGCFSNFAAYPFRLHGDLWPTSEHYFQAQKFEDLAHRRAIRIEKSPMIAARMGRDRKKKLRRDWESVKVSIMTDAVRAKFLAHEDIRAILLSTGNAKLVEHTTNDAYWGDGGDGSGKNMLGQILMRIREELRSTQPSTGSPT
jgi:ribA/ribD-fused uncharacterized protein